MSHALRPRTDRWWLIVCVIALLGAGCGQAPRTEPGPASGEMPDQEVSDFVVTETDAGQPQWTLYARSAAIYNARNAIIAHGVRVDFFDDIKPRNSRPGSGTRSTRRWRSASSVHPM
jgi:hypothetical protein